MLGLMNMKQKEVDEIISCLNSERRVFYYFKDRYCFDLVDMEMSFKKQEYVKIAELKSGYLKRILQNETVSKSLKNCGSGILKKSDIPLFWSHDALAFNLSLARWGDSDRGWDQTSRNQCNLVLQLNFSRQHDEEYSRLVKPTDEYGPFECWSHPVREGDRNTMSWIRMDINFDTNEVLIEEIQNDWLRNASAILKCIKKRRVEKPKLKPKELYYEIAGEFCDLEYYVNHTLATYQKIWAEASMLAALNFIRFDLGVSNVYYHSFDTGNKLKDVCGSPPKSLYTKLPKQFGFELTETPPDLLINHSFSRRCIKAIENPNWYYRAI